MVRKYGFISSLLVMVACIGAGCQGVNYKGESLDDRMRAQCRNSQHFNHGPHVRNGTEPAPVLPENNCERFNDRGSDYDPRKIRFPQLLR